MRSTLGDDHSVKKVFLIIAIFGCLFLLGCRLEIDPEFLPSAEIALMAKQQFIYSLSAGFFSFLLIIFGLYLMTVGHWFGFLPIILGGGIIFVSRYEIVSKRNVPDMAEEIENIPRRLAAEFSNLDSVALKYLQEAIGCLKYNIIRGAAICLGASSERLIDELIRVFTESIEDKIAKEKFIQRTNGKTISKRYEEFLKALNGSKNKPNEKWANDLPKVLDQMFQFLRIIRNESAHPFGESEIKREMVISQVGQFYKYAEMISKLMKFFEDNKINL